MKKLLVGLLLVASSVLSFGAQRVPYEKLSFPGGYISYNDEKFTGEFERKDPRTGKINMVGSVKNGELHGTSYSYDENGKLEYKGEYDSIKDKFMPKLEKYRNKTVRSN